MYFRLHQNGCVVYQRLQCSWSKNREHAALHANPYRTLKNMVGGGARLHGPQQGNVPRSRGGGLITGAQPDISQNLGERSGGFGRPWERLHMMGVGAAKLEQRDYSNYNTLIGSHALNSAMIPFEGIVSWVIGQKRKHIYSLTTTTKPLMMERAEKGRHVEWAQTPVLTSITQALSYTSENDDSVWINLTNTSVCPIVGTMQDDEQVHYQVDVPDQWKMSILNFEQMQQDIRTLDDRICAIQDRHNSQFDAWRQQTFYRQVQ